MSQCSATVSVASETLRSREKRICMRKQIYSVFIAAIIAGFCFPAYSQKGRASSSVTPPTQDEIAKLANDLGAAKFADRESATKKLTKLGFYARSAVRKALKSKDPEVRERAEKIWSEIRWAVFPGARSDIGVFVSKLESGSMDVSEKEWGKFAAKYGASMLPLIVNMNDSPKTATYAKTGLIAIIAGCPAANIAKTIKKSPREKELKKLLGSMRIKNMQIETRKNLFDVLRILDMAFEIVDLTASTWRHSQKSKLPHAAMELLDDKKAAIAIYDKALETFNDSSPTLEKDWKLCFYATEAEKRGYAKLMEQFFKELDYHPTRPRVNLLLAENLLKLSLCTQAIELISGNWSSTATYLRLIAARKLKNSDRKKELRELLMDAISGDNAKMYSIARLAGKFKDPLAKTLYEKIVASKKSDIYTLNARLKLAAASEKSGKIKEALVLYEKALTYSVAKDEKGNKRNLNTTKGNLTLFLNKRISLLKSQIKGGIENWRKGMEALKAKNYNKALKKFDAFIKRSPDLPQAYSNQALALSKLKQYDKALQALNKAITTSDGEDSLFTIRMILRKSTILESTKRYSDVVKLLEKEIKKHPNTPALYSILGFNAYFAREYGKSAEAFKLFREFKPNDMYSALWRFNALKHLKLDPAPAFAKFAAALTSRRWPKPVVDFYAGKISYEQCLAEAKSEKPKRDNEMKCEAYFYIAEHLLLAGKKSKANAFFKKCLKCDIQEFLETKETKIRLNSGGVISE